MLLLGLLSDSVPVVQLTSVTPSELQVGMPVEMVTRKLREEGEDGLIVYGYKFRRAIEKAAYIN